MATPHLYKHDIIEGLHPQRYAIDAPFGKAGQQIRRHVGRMQFHGELRIGGKVFTQRIEEWSQAAERRRSAAEVDRTQAFDGPFTDFVRKAGDIGGPDVFRNAGTRLERAIRALATAEREMDVQVHRLNGIMDQQYTANRHTAR